MPIRSLLYAPGNRPDLMSKVARSGAHAIILDLEDAVPPDEKARACALVSEWLEAGPSLPAFVRLNGGAAALQDLSRLTRANLAGVLVPKAEDPALLVEIDRALAASPDILIQPLIETVAGLYGMDALAAASRRIRRFSFGAGDCIHPSQVPIINAAFGLTEADLAGARRVRAAYAEAKAAGRGSLLLEDGTFIDEAVDLRAKDLLKQAS